LAFLYNPGAIAQAKALQAQIYAIFKKCNQHEGLCDVCGDSKYVAAGAGFALIDAPKLCIRHRCGWNSTLARHGRNQDVTLFFARYLTNILTKTKGH
jgi:hypothetical protein